MTTDRLFKFILEHVNDAGPSMNFNLSFFYKDILQFFLLLVKPVSTCYFEQVYY